MGSVGPGVDSASNRNEYQEYFLGGKSGRCLRLTTLPPSCADCLQNRGASGSVQACNGIALPLHGVSDGGQSEVNTREPIVPSSGVFQGWMALADGER
jgi:hypothetical protein